MNATEHLKQQAAQYAVRHYVEDHMIVGLGTGSTARYALEAIAARRAAGELQHILGVPTSQATARLARKLDIPLTTLEAHPVIDVTIDGADEVAPDLSLIKGGGGALLWEKIVALASHRRVIVVDESKRVDRLGTRIPLPVEVVPFGWRTLWPFLEGLGAIPRLRMRSLEGKELPFTTDSGHYIIDCEFPEGIVDPQPMAETLKAQVGVVEHGLFLNIATEVIVATSQGIEVMRHGEISALHSVR